MSLIHGFMGLFFPANCLGCRSKLDRFGLCTPCLHQLTPRVGPRCTLCDMALRTLKSSHICGRCLDNRPIFDAAFGVFEYSGPVGRAIRYGKYARIPEAIGYVADQVTCALPEALIADPPDAVIPVPSHWRRVYLRGCEPPLIIAEQVSQRLGCPTKATFMKRVVNTMEQAALDIKARRRNVASAFRCRPEPPADVLVVDDVFTTGSTANAVARTLRVMGSTRIRVLCAAYVDPPHTRAISDGTHVTKERHSGRH